MPDLNEALAALNPSNDDHWTKGGEPDLRHLTEAVGSKITRAMVKEAAPDLNRESQNPNVETPLAEVSAEPHENDPMTNGQEIIRRLEEVDSLMTAETRTMQPELMEVVRAWRANKPSIMERQKRLAIRAAR